MWRFGKEGDCGIRRGPRGWDFGLCEPQKSLLAVCYALPELVQFLPKSLGTHSLGLQAHLVQGEGGK